MNYIDYLQMFINKLKDKNRFIYKNNKNEYISLSEKKIIKCKFFNYNNLDNFVKKEIENYDRKDLLLLGIDNTNLYFYYLTPKNYKTFLINSKNIILNLNNEDFEKYKKTLKENEKFLSLKTTKKGFMAEKYVINKLQEQYDIYQPAYLGSENFDYLFINKKNNEKWLGDAKAKSRRTYYPDTGIDVRLYEKYLKHSNKLNLNFFLYFIDENNKEIYGNFLHILKKEKEVNYKSKKLIYPLIQKEIIYWHIEDMKFLDKIDDKMIKKLSENNQRNYQQPNDIYSTKDK